MPTDRDALLWMYRTMETIRAFEERVQREFAKGDMPGFVHMYIGEEAVATGVCAHLTDEDFITSTHRGHGHCIAKGCSLPEMLAELYGRETGLCKGRGGSMHIADFRRGMLGANAIVGGGIAIATGGALSAQVRGTKQVAVAFFGDGAANQGVFHESLNLAAIWQLPAIYVCENNGWAESTPTGYSTSVADIADRSAAYGIPGIVVDGSDVLAVSEAAEAAIGRARNGQGPTLIEAKVHRLAGHYVGDPQGYRDRGESKALRAFDPITRFRGRLEELGVLTGVNIELIQKEILRELDDAVEHAKSGPWPRPEEVTAHVYVDE